MNIKKLVLRCGTITFLATSVFSNKYKLETIDDSKIIEEQNISIKKNNVTTVGTSINEISDKEKIQKENVDLIDKYCSVFSLDSELVSSKIIKYTNSFNSKLWIEENKIINCDVDFENKEQAIIYFIKSISKEYENYGFDSNVFVENDYEPSVKCEGLVEKYSNIFNIKKEIAMSIIYTESGYNLDSYNFTHRNNPAGAGHTVYRNLEVGIIYHIMNLKYNYSYCDLESINFFSQARSKYCPDNNGAWISSNEYFYQKLDDDYYCIFDERNNKVLVK